MRTLTLFRAYAQATYLRERALQRRREDWKIQVAKDEYAKKYQRRNRQAAKLSHALNERLKTGIQLRKLETQWARWAQLTIAQGNEVRIEQINHINALEAENKQLMLKNLKLRKELYTQRFSVHIDANRQYIVVMDYDEISQEIPFPIPLAGSVTLGELLAISENLSAWRQYEIEVRDANIACKRGYGND